MSPLDRKKNEIDNTQISIMKDSSLIRDSSKERDEKEQEQEELRKRRQRTEKHVAILAKENPELLDLKSKEILSRIDPKHMRRNNQLDSLDNDNSKLKRSLTKERKISDVNMSIKIDPIKSLFNDNSKQKTVFNRNDGSGETPRLLSCTKEGESKREDGIITYHAELNIRDIKDTSRSYQSKASSLNRARIITNIDELRDDDDQVEYENFQLEINLKNKEIQRRKEELEDLLKDLEDQSEVALSRRISKIEKEDEQNFAEIPDSLRNYETKPTVKTTSIKNKSIDEEIKGLLISNRNSKISSGFEVESQKRKEEAKDSSINKRILESIDNDSFLDIKEDKIDINESFNWEI